MKSIIRYLIPVAGLAAAFPALRAEDTGPKEKREMRVIVGPDDGAPSPQRHRRVIRLGGPHEKESVTFLGIETSPADSALADQLGLPKGAGLVVRGVVPDSPAAAVLKPHDVVLKLDDQLLIEQRQLSVLVRNHQEGDEVTLTYIRGGKETTAKVKLAKHDVPKMAMMNFGPGPGFFNLPLGDGQPMPGAGREDMDRVLSLMDHGGPDEPGEEMHSVHAEHNDGPGVRTVTVSTSNSNMVFTDEKGSLDLTIKDGKKNLVAKNAKGEQVFSGSVTTPEERKALPVEVRERLERLEDMQEYSFKTDDDFTPGETKDVRPLHKGIALPSRESVAPASRGSMPF